MRTVDSIQDIQDMARGAVLLGTGGGGDPYIGELFLLAQLKRGRMAHVVDAGEVADDDVFTERLAAYCQQLCEWSPITLRLLKRGLTKSLETADLETQLRYEVANIRIAFASEDAKEARKAFFEKRKPVFTGR